jgi:hypothetical protein
MEPSQPEVPRHDDPWREKAEQTYALFREYHAENPHLWLAIEQVSLRLVANRDHFSIQAIYEQVRYYRPEAANGFPFDYKINNIFRPFYVRGFCLKYPEHRHRFEYRRAFVDLVELDVRLFC